MKLKGKNTLKGRNIIVTGGSVGIGLAVSEKIASEGGTVIMMARDKDNLLKATELLNTTYSKIHKTKHHHFVGGKKGIRFDNFYEKVQTLLAAA